MLWCRGCDWLLALAAQKAGKTEEARTQFQLLIGDRNTPPSIGERARIMLAMLTEAELARPPSAATAPAPETKAPAPEKSSK